jgi:hypothetical protein
MSIPQLRKAFDAVGVETQAPLRPEFVLNAVKRGKVAVMGGLGSAPGTWYERGDKLGVDGAAGYHFVTVSDHEPKDDTFLVHDPASTTGPFRASAKEVKAFTDGWWRYYPGGAGIVVKS